MMDISNVEYEPMSMINDVSNIIMTRIGSKDLELTVDVNPNLPMELYGDNIRIKQVMVNLANNAVKFTKAGNVNVKIDFLPDSGGYDRTQCRDRRYGKRHQRERYEQTFSVIPAA